MAEGGSDANSPGMNELELALKTSGGILKTARCRHLRHQIARALHSGALIRPFPGVVVAPDLAQLPETRALAAACWQPNAVLMGDAAALLTFLPNQPLRRLELAGRPPGTIPTDVRFRRLAVPAELRIVTDQAQLTVAELTVLDLAMRDDWRPLCEALRRDLVTQDSLRSVGEVLAQTRRDRLRLADCLTAASGNPWSVPEYDLQQLYRRHGITGWTGNQRMRLGMKTVVPDLTFEEQRVICAVDSWEFHGSREAFEADREWHNELTALGWTILHFTPTQIWHQPDRVMAWTWAALAGGAPDGDRSAGHARVDGEAA